MSVGICGPSRTAVTRPLANQKARMGERLQLLYELARSVANQLAPYYPPMIVWVEQPSGRYPNPQLSYATGAIQAGLYAALAYRYPAPVDVRTIPSSTWKKQAIGHGNASDVQVMAWARANGYDSDSEHEADALAIAVAGARLIGLPA